MSPGSSESGERLVLNEKAAGSNPAQGSTYHYAIVRKGLKPEPSMAQLGHAAGESASQYTAETGIRLPDTTRMVVLGATKEELATLRFDLEEAEVPHVAIAETEGELAGVTTAIGLVTVDRDTLKALVPALAQLRPWRA